jgi:hypothetical protein
VVVVVVVLGAAVVFVRASLLVGAESARGRVVVVEVGGAVAEELELEEDEDEELAPLGRRDGELEDEEVVVVVVARFLGIAPPTKFRARPRSTVYSPASLLRPCGGAPFTLLPWSLF